MAVHVTTSLSGISSNSVRASLIRPLSKYDVMRFVAKMDGLIRVLCGFCWVQDLWDHTREFVTTGGILLKWKVEVAVDDSSFLAFILLSHSLSK